MEHVVEALSSKKPSPVASIVPVTANPLSSGSPGTDFHPDPDDSIRSYERSKSSTTS